MKISILNTAISNIESVKAAFRRLGAETFLVEKTEEILSATNLILPGVGAFKAGMDALRDNGFDKALAERIKLDKPTLGICLGMQLLFSESEESPGVEGLGIFTEKVKRFSNTVRVPHFGWNSISSELPYGNGYAYFANSYRVVEAPAGADILWCEHGGKFVAGLKKGNLTAYQFHPEISGEFGSKLLKTWMEEAC